MKKIILVIAMTSSFIFADCSEFIKDTNTDCVEASECLKNETILLANTLERLALTSKKLNEALIRHANDSARCEVYKEYARKNTDIRRWQVLAEDCQTHYINFGNTLSTAKRNLNVISNTTRLKRQIEASEASFMYIKDKCNNQKNGESPK